MSAADAGGPPEGTDRRTRVLLAVRRFAARMLLPRRIREIHGDEMEAAFEDRLREAAAAGEGAATRVLARELADFGRVALGYLASRGRRASDTVDGEGIVETTLRDFRTALRGFARRPGFTVVAVASLALGIGSATAMFALVDGVLLRPLAYGAPDRLVHVHLTIPSLGWERGPVSFPVFDEWRRRSGAVFESLSAYQAGQRRTLAVGGEPQIVAGTLVTGETFATLGRAALVGRTLEPADEGPGRERVVVLSHALWTEAFGADPAVVDRRIDLGGEPHTVVGVMPADFPGLWAPERFWIPFDVDPGSLERDMNFLGTVGLLRSGIEPGAAREAMERLTREMEAEDPLGLEARSVRMPTRAEVVTGNVRTQLLVLLGAVVVLLAIACANLAGLLLVRGASRGRELSVRAALGAERGRLVRALLTESLMLAAAGALLSIPFAWALLRGISVLGPRDLPRMSEVGLDGSPLLFCAACAVLAAVASGLVPALRSTRELRSDLAGTGAAGGGPSVLQRGLAVGQVALGTLLLTGAGLLAFSLLRLEGAEDGFDPRGVLTFRVAPPAGLEQDEVVAFHAEILDGLRGLPGASAAGATWALPLGGMYGSSALRTEESGEEHTVEIVPVAGAYVEAMGMRIVSGRGLAPGDEGDGGETRILVNESFAERAWPGEEAVGKRLLEEEDGEVEAVYRVVGVVADVALRGAGAEPELQGFWPWAATPWARDLFFVVRTEGDPASLGPAVRALMRRVDERVPVSDMSTMDARVARHLAEPRFRTLLAGAFAVGAFGLSLLGIYGVISFGVGRRTREIGVRIALGAERRRVLGEVLRGGLVLATSGVLLGLGGAAASARVLDSLLFEVEPLEPGVYAAVAAAMLGAALLASWLPARRAASVPPTTALRAE